jgi:serine phosphatase RsbU (regulator of sigma subunit)
VTLFYAKLDVPSRRIQYTNAGHFPPFILRSLDEVLWLDEGGPPVGLIPEVTYKTASMDLLLGDTLVLYTDGVIEAENREGEQYSKERLVNLVRDNPRLGARELITAIHSSVSAFTGSPELQDDFTLVVLRLLPDNAAANGR